ncbi:MAG: hypothetical protein WCH65_01315 [bacterium]
MSVAFMINGTSPPAITISVGDCIVMFSIGHGRIFIVCCFTIQAFPNPGQSSILSVVVPAFFSLMTISNI